MPTPVLVLVVIVTTTIMPGQLGGYTQLQLSRNRRKSSTSGCWMYNTRSRPWPGSSRSRVPKVLKVILDDEPAPARPRRRVAVHPHELGVARAGDLGSACALVLLRLTSRNVTSIPAPRIPALSATISSKKPSPVPPMTYARTPAAARRRKCPSPTLRGRAGEKYAFPRSFSVKWRACEGM